MHGPDWWRDGRAVVRPFGHRHDDPIVRRVGDRDCFLGNVHAADPSRHDRSFDHVLSATHDPQPLTTHHRPLVDGHEADWTSFESAADAACRLVGDGSLLIHCLPGGAGRVHRGQVVRKSEMSVITTIRMTPMTGDTASSSCKSCIDACLHPTSTGSSPSGHRECYSRHDRCQYCISTTVQPIDAVQTRLGWSRSEYQWR